MSSISNPGGASAVLDRQVSTQTVVSTTTETSVYSKSVPANTLGSNKTLRASVIGDFLNNTGSNNGYTLRVKFGGVTIFTYTETTWASGASRGSFNFQVDVQNQSAAAQVARFLGTLANTIYANATGTVVSTGAQGGTNSGLTVDTTSNQTFEITVQPNVNNANLSIRIFSVVLEVL